MWRTLKTQEEGNVWGGGTEWVDFPIEGHTKLILQICVGELCGFADLISFSVCKMTREKGGLDGNFVYLDIEAGLCSG